MANNNTLLDLVRAERERRQSGPADCVIFRYTDITDADFQREVDEERRSGRIGPNTRVTEFPWGGPRLHKRLV